jgi:hypothetical protein
VVRGDANGAWSAVAEAIRLPSSSRISAREPLVPTSMPRTGMAYLLFSRPEETAETAESAKKNILLCELSVLCGSI